MASTSNPQDAPVRMVACRISHDFTAPVAPEWNPKDFIDVSAGELGYVLGRYQRGNMIFLSVEIRHGRIHKLGLVPEACVTLGAKYAETMLVQLPQQREWATWYRYDRGAYIYRTNRCIQIDERNGQNASMFVAWRSGGFNIYVPVNLQKESGLQKGDSVTLEVEISNDSEGRYTPAMVPWIRVPRICRNAEFEKLRSMSLQLQWRDKTTNELKTTPIQWGTEMRRSEDELRMLIQGMALFQTLTQLVYSNPPAWQSPLDETAISQIQIDHMRQKAQMGLLAVPRTLKVWPADYSISQNTQRLQQAIPPQMRGKIFIGAKPAKGLGRPRNDCDMCFSLYSTTKCDHSPATGTCTPCSTLNRPCT